MKKLFTLAAAVLASFSMWAETTYHLLTDDGKINTTDFYTTITSVNTASATFTEADESSTVWGYNVTFGSSRSTAFGQTANLFEYSAKSTQTLVKIYTVADNKSRKISVQEFVEGSVPTSDPGVTETFNLGATGAAEIWSYTSENTKPRTLYFIGNNGSIKICQIVIEEVGTPLPQGGQVGYATLLKNGRHAIKSGTVATLDGITYSEKSDLKSNGGKGAVMRGATNSIKFTTTEKVVLKVVEANKKGYYLTDDAEETYNDAKAIKTGNADFILEAGNWTILCNTSSDTQIDSIAFTAYVQSDDATLKSISVGGSALDLSKFEEKDGALQYDYELTMGTTEVPEVAYELNDAGASAVKTDAANVDGTTTIVVTAEDGTTTKTYKINFSVKSELGHDATLSSLKINGEEALEADKFAYELEIGVYEALPTITYTLNDPNASAELTAATEEAKVATIVVTAEDGETEKTYTVTITRAEATELVAISESTTWAWTKAGGKAPEFTDATTPTRNEWFNFADVLPSPDASFKAESLEGMLQFANRDNNSYAQGHKLRFKTTVPGNVSVEFSNTGTKDVARNVYINGVDTEAGAKNTNKVTTPEIAVPAGIVLIEGMEMLETPTANMLRFYKVTFTKSVADAIDNVNGEAAAVKRIVNGMLVIERDGKAFNAMGQAIR